MPSEKAIELWSAWPDDLHTTDDAKKRIKSAKSSKLTPIKVDPDDLYGYFQGGHGRYETFLDFCPCGDFRRRHAPCKHIYRLAMELGLMDGDFSTNTAAIATPKKERALLDDTIDIVESLSDDAQDLLKNITRNMTSENPTKELANANPAALSDLIESGLISQVGDAVRKIKFGTKANIAALLDAHEIEYLKSAKKSDLETLCIDNIKDAAIDTFGETVYATVALDTRYSAQSIYRYLYRKLDVKRWYNFDMEKVGTPLLETDLPDDAVTDQLVKRGYYTRK